MTTAAPYDRYVSHTLYPFTSMSNKPLSMFEHKNGSDKARRTSYKTRYRLSMQFQFFQCSIIIRIMVVILLQVIGDIFDSLPSGLPEILSTKSIDALISEGIGFSVLRISPVTFWSYNTLSYNTLPVLFSTSWLHPMCRNCSVARDVNVCFLPPYNAFGLAIIALMYILMLRTPASTFASATCIVSAIWNDKRDKS